MGIFEKLKDVYSSTGVYGITEGSNIFFELKAYSAGLDMLKTAIEELEAEAFVPTAKTYGLARREIMVGAVRKDLPLQERRNMLLKRSSFGNEDFTLEGIRKILEFLGIKGNIQEYPSQNRVVIKVENRGLTKGQRNWMISQIRELFPAHLESDAVFEGFSWADSDSSNLTFDEMESTRKNWSEIDYYCI